ncbi:MAG: alpha-L-fucosidase [Prevotellaceae bacterium]|jgi:alpha-L-fucosidase|nr:alpha-L-fucosidase [Prevotellaceae bacterium]
MKSKLLLICFSLSLSHTLSAQFVHGQSDAYILPDEPSVVEKLEQWKDLKFGMIVHWGLYSIPGIVESWSICSEDEDWIPRDSLADYNEYKQWYWDLSKQFNPLKFNPDQWAKAGVEAGMKYLVFTTKHHDGFCMFDTRETDFSIARGPFKDNPKADVAKYVFESFRKFGYMIGAYFSKPDWHSQDYWWKRYATSNRSNNYDVRKHPWKWESFKQFTFKQISELMSNYGQIDILWLDGGWVRPIPESSQNSRRWSQDIDMPKIAKMAREKQKGLLIVDRTVHGKYENYQTPEQSIPAKQLPYPWETCMTLGKDWGYVPGQTFKSSHKVIHSLIEIVAKGGSLLLGVGPSSEGLLPDEVVSRLQEIGKWTSQNSEAIYNTRSTKHYNDGNTWFTQSKDGKMIYAMVCLPENQDAPSSVEWKGNTPAKGSTMILLHTGKKVKWTVENERTIVNLPKNLPKNLPALTFKIRLLDV